MIFTVIAVGLVFLGLEGAARVAEPHFFPQERKIPLPAPGIDRNDPGLKEIEAANAALKKSPPEWRDGIPMVADDALGWALPKGAKIIHGDVNVEINSLGIRGPEIPPKGPDDLHLLTIGDSSIFGHGVPYASIFSTVAAQLLSDSWSKTVVPINGATPGHDTAQSLHTLRRLLPQVQADIVVIGNLWSDIYAIGSPLGADAMKVVPPVQDALRDFALYRFLRQLYSPILNQEQVRWIEDREDIGDIQVPGSTRTALPDYVSNLREMVRMIKAAGAKPAFVILPAPLDADKVPPPDTVQQFRFAMAKVAEESGAPLLNGPAVFANEENMLGYFSDAVHPSAEGHLLLGKALAETLAGVSK